MDIKELHINDKVQCKDGTTGIILRLQSIEYINYLKKLNKLDAIGRMTYKYENDSVEHPGIMYDSVYIYDSNDSIIKAISVNDIARVLSKTESKSKKPWWKLSPNCF